jgi:demethylmenaquinone methyltransferase / 2-methoxy-6-polyprenyl-1,4-benzoquinol methylase
MANEFYDPGSERVAKVNRLFTRIARRYDLLNDIQSFGLHRLWKRRVVRMSRVHTGERALDVCCGTGDIAFALASRGAETVGFDFNESMLQVATHRQARALSGPNSDGGKANPVFLLGDAQQVPFQEKHFDVVTVGYGLRNLRHWQSGLREMSRVARPGARLLVLDFGKPDNAIWRAVYFGYLRLFVPVLGLVFCGSASAYAYILESLRHYPAQNGVAGEMRQLGLKNVQVHNLLGGIMSINYAEKL